MTADGLFKPKVLSSLCFPKFFLKISHAKKKDGRSANMCILVKKLFVQLSASRHLLQTRRERKVSLSRILTLFYHGDHGGSNVATHFFHAIALSKLRNGEGERYMGMWRVSLESGGWMEASSFFSSFLWHASLPPSYILLLLSLSLIFFRGKEGLFSNISGENAVRLRVFLFASLDQNICYYAAV